MQWGITCFFETKKDFKLVAEIAPQYPLSYLEIRGERPFFSPEDLTDNDLAFFREIISQTNLRVTLHSTFYDINIATLNRFLREAVLSCYKEYLNLGAQVGAEIMVVHGGYIHHQAAEVSGLVDVARQNLITNLRILGEYAGQKDMKIGLENSPPNKNPLMVPDWKPQMEILRAVNHPAVGAVFDTAHAYLHHLDIFTYYETIKDYLIEIHVHNNDGQQDLHWGLHRGRIDYSTFLRNRDITVPIVIEARDMTEAKESLNFIKTFEEEGT